MSAVDNRPQILVTGGNGQVALEIKDIAESNQQFNFIFLSKEELAIDNKDAVMLFFEKNHIQYVINCAAYTAVDKAEQDKEKAFLINGDAVGNLAAICKMHGAVFIHLSTDYVYDGKNKKPLMESNAVSPLNVYGWSKLKGEELALNQNSNSIIIRTSWVYSPYGNNFVKTMLRLFKEKPAINVINDQYGCPTYAADLASVIIFFIQQIEAGYEFSGIYNYCNKGIISWYDFANGIKNIKSSDCIINAIPAASYITPAIRPAYSVLDTTKIKNDLGITIPNWKVSLEKCIELLAS